MVTSSDFPTRPLLFVQNVKSHLSFQQLKVTQTPVDTELGTRGCRSCKCQWGYAERVLCLPWSREAKCLLVNKTQSLSNTFCRLCFDDRIHEGSQKLASPVTISKSIEQIYWHYLGDRTPGAHSSSGRPKACIWRLPCDSHEQKVEKNLWKETSRSRCQLSVFVRALAASQLCKLDLFTFLASLF